MVQWLRLCSPKAGRPGLIPDQIMEPDPTCGSILAWSIPWTEEPGYLLREALLDHPA